MENNNFKLLDTDSLTNINGGDGFWNDLGKWVGNHTMNGSWNTVMESYCRNNWGISYKEYCKLMGIK